MLISETMLLMEAVRFLGLQGSVGQLGPPGPQGLPGEGIQGQKVPGSYNLD